MKDVIDPRKVENDKFAAKLAPLKLTVREATTSTDAVFRADRFAFVAQIRSDGHCLYRAVADQLDVWGKNGVDLKQVRNRTRGVPELNQFAAARVHDPAHAGGRPHARAPGRFHRVSHQRGRRRHV